MNCTRVFKNSVKTLKERLFEYITPYEIYCNFIGYELEVGKFILSPIRTDKKPTFMLFIPEDKDEVFFKDFAWVGGDVFKFVKLYTIYNEGLTLNNMYEIVTHIDKKLGLGVFDPSFKNDNLNLIHKKLDKTFFTAKRTIKFKSREFTDIDLNYWGSYHITKETLDFFNVRSVKKFLNDNDEVIFTVNQRTLTFAYVIFNKIKIYRPEDRLEFKWRNTCPGYYLQGLEQIKKLETNNKKLIVTKSLKDVMVFYEFLKDEYDILAPHSETYNFTDREINWMRRKYDEVIIIFDYDLAGVSGANKLRKKDPELFKVTFVSTKRFKINGKLKVIDKDISDFAFERTEEDIRNKLIKIGL